MLGLPGVTPGIEESQNGQTVTYSQAISQVPGAMPVTAYPVNQWNAQYARYQRYRAWFDGVELNKTMDGVLDDQDNPVLLYPLQINPIRNFARKLAGISLGESEVTYNPPIKTLVEALPPLDGSELDKVPENIKKMARAAETIMNEIWTQSGGYSLMYENAINAWLMGGAVFKVAYRPLRKDVRIPFFIEKVLPEHFLPVWNPKNPLELFECFEIYRIPGAVAKYQYGIETGLLYVMYVEHWTKKKFSVYVAGEPIRADYNGTERVLKDVDNMFGEVPYIYAASQRDGASFFGSSFVEDILGLATEFNARYADSGDAVRDTVHRKSYMRNVHQTTSEKNLGHDNPVIDLGTELPTSKHPPDVFTVDPPNYSPEMINYPESLWQQMLREAGLQNVAFGEDEASQRSGLTMAFRMWPTTVKARTFRSFWGDALNMVAFITLSGVTKRFSQYIPEDFSQSLKIYQDWLPMIPRDREQEINEAVLLKQAKLRSTETALDRLGDIRDVPEEVKKIDAESKAEADLQAQTKLMGAGGGAGSGAAKSKIPTPVADNASDVA